MCTLDLELYSEAHDSCNVAEGEMVNGGHFQKGMTARSLNVGSRAAETRHLEFCYLFEQSRNLGRH